MTARPSPSAPVAGTTAPRERVDRALLDFLEVDAGAFARSPEASAMVAEIARVVRAGGKRLRPLFCYWGHRAAGAPDADEIVRAAASLELLHTFAIVHDDVMDRSPLRRGEPATYRRLAAQSPGGGPGAAHFGVSAAILVGDLAMALADRLFLGSGFPPARLLAGAEVYQAMRAEVVEGQYLDLVAASKRAATPAEVRRISALKSGGYTVEKPLLIGAALAGAPAEMLRALARFGAPLGEAFQLRDDVLGAFGDPSVTGKDADSDFREGKQTLLVALARERAPAPDRAFLGRRLGAPDLSAEEVERAREVIRSSGALEETERTIGALVAAAREALAAAALPGEAEAALADLTGLIGERER